MVWGAIASAAGNLVGQAASNIWSSAEANKNRSWQEYMSNTQYQRAMADMKKAGLNPILAYKMGGAPMGSGSMANIGNLGAGFSGFGQTLASAQQADAATLTAEANAVLTKAKTITEQHITDRTIAEQMLKEAETSLKYAQINLTEEQAAKTFAEMQNIFALFENIRAQTSKTWSEAAIADLEAQWAEGTMDIAEEMPWLKGTIQLLRSVIK